MNARRVCMLAAVILCSGSLLIASAADKPQTKASAMSLKDVTLTGPSNTVPASTSDSSANTAMVPGKVAPGNTSANPIMVYTNQGTQVPLTPATPSHGFAYGARGVGFDGSPGTDAPPALLGGFPMTPFPTDPRPTGTEVTDIPVPAPCTGIIAIDSPTIPFTRNAIGSGWATWSHGYTGDVYTTYSDPGVVTLTMPADVCAIYFYVEPNTFTPEFDVTCVANLGLATEVSSGPVPALGDSGAVYFGFFASTPDHIETITITVDPAANGWAMGEFGIVCGTDCVVAPVACCFESTATCIDQYDLTQCIAEGGRYTLGVEYCADLDPLCGALIGACCAGPDAEVYEPYECIGDMTQVECYALPEEDTNWTFGESCAATPPFDCNEPTYCDVSYSDCSDTPREICESAGAPDDWIMNVTFAEINNSTFNEPCPDSYGDYTDQVAYVAYSVTYNLSVETCGEGSWNECTTAWIDWNGDKVFDEATERYDLGCGTNVVLDMDITVPPTAVPGYTRMRVIEAYNAPAADACVGGTYGETEDYTLLISGDIPTGACCDPTTGICAEDVLATECTSPSQFAMDALCADAFPNCGNPGACCDDDSGDCVEDVLELDCTGTRFIAGGVCADLDPTCGDVPWIFDFTPGFEAPPEMLFGCPMTPFPDDPRPTLTDVYDIPWPCPIGGLLEFDIAMSHRKIGDGWMSWSHGYTGDVYYTNGAQSVTMTVPPATCGMYFYVEPNPFEDHLFTVTVNGFWVSEEFVANGEGLAAYAGISGDNIQTVTVASATTDFAIGEFAACCFCGEFYGSCCDPYTGICADGVEVRCCPAGHMWDPATCADRVPACGNPGACCDITTGDCQDEVLELNCEGGRFEAGGECEELEPPCGTPGACCIDETATCTIEFEANCEGRFIAGAVCDPDPWEALGQPACGDWTCAGMLYAPSNPDNEAFRTEIAGFLGGGAVCDYWDSAASTPTLEDLQDYCCVFVWGNYAFADAVAYGNVLAEYVDQGGKVLLGQWTLHTTQSNWLEGMIMEPAYCPVTGTGYGADSYVDGSGSDPIFVDVHTLSGSYFDQCDPIAGAVSDGLLAGGKIAAAWRADRAVYYLPGATAPDLTSGDLARFVAQACLFGGGPVIGACCDPTTGTCTDDVLYADCVGQFAYDGTCAADFPNCGDRGACCNVYDGTVCDDNVLALDCPADWRHEPGEECEELEPECGTPGACCIDDTATCTIEYQANCEGRFLPGAVCDPDPWEALGQPACGDWTCAGMLYAPSNADDSVFRADIAAILGGGAVCDYWDSSASTPTLADLQDYCCVFVWGNYAFADAVAYGNVLAEYVDAGGKVILGQWTYHTTQSNWLEGMIMEPAYCPVTATSYGSDSYVDGSGMDSIFVDVHTLSGSYFDQCDPIAGAVADGLLAGGKIAAAWRADRAVYYLPGATAPALTTGDLAQFVANVCRFEGGPVVGACCDPTTGVCADDVDYADCAGQFAYEGTCADDFPNCGNPGACCIDATATCTIEFEVNCAGRFIAGAACDPDPWEALGFDACGDYTACEHSITLWDDYGDGWNDGMLDVFVDGILVLDDITIASGSGPESWTFDAGTGSVIETVYTPGGWPYENSYCIYSGTGDELICDGMGGVDPVGITTAGSCEAGFCGDGSCTGDEDVCTCPEDCGDYECLNQAPNASNGIFSDVGCASCTGGDGGLQVLAENFTVCADDEIEIDAIGFWGGYYPSNTPIDPDIFTVIIKADDGAGLPGAAIATFGPMAATTKATTGVSLFGVDEYVYTIDLDPNVTLTGGTYWIELYNDTSASTDEWFWEAGDLDTVAGIIGQAYSFYIPEEPWNYDGATDMAIEVICVSGAASPKVDPRLDRRQDSRRTYDAPAQPSIFGASR